MELYELIERPDLDQPVLVMALEGWIDAGLAAGTASSVLLDELDSVTVARFDADTFFDYRARRPTVHMVDGVMRGLTWPSVELRAAADLEGNELLILTGHEPDRSWGGFVDSVVQLALDFEARMCVGFGAYPAPAPHTRPARMACCASTINLAETGFIRASLEFPGGAQAAIEQACDSQDIPSLGLWAQVPHYAAAMTYPPSSVSLIESLAHLAGLSLPFGDLPEQAEATRSRLDELISHNPEHEAMLAQLEAAYEKVNIGSLTEVDLPTGDELADAFEQFLRDQPDS
jgi:predicted ATP-grasp superfamily ATP-dependent carboligase